jgi:hypothetical protein
MPEKGTNVFPQTLFKDITALHIRSGLLEAQTEENNTPI